MPTPGPSLPLLELTHRVRWLAGRDRSEVWGCWFLKNSKPLKDLCLVLTNACLEPPIPRVGHPSPASFCTGSFWQLFLAWIQGRELGWGLPRLKLYVGLCVMGGVTDCVWKGQGRGFLRRVKEVLELS